MRVTYFSATGTIRMVYLNVSSIYQHDGNSVVSVNREKKCVDNSPNVVIDNLRSYTYEYPLALINLAPGEYVERSEDAERS
jgi:hypothetical protein